MIIKPLQLNSIHRLWPWPWQAPGAFCPFLIYSGSLLDSMSITIYDTKLIRASIHHPSFFEPRFRYSHQCGRSETFKIKFR